MTEEDRKKIAEDLDRELAALANKCPKCGSDMEKGFLTAQVFLWSREPHNSITVWPRFVPSHVLTQGVEMLARGADNITVLSAYRCEKCKLLLANYEEARGKGVLSHE
jgi:phage FluMu protein Com